MASSVAGGLTVAILAVALVLGGLGAGVVLTGHGVLGASTVTTTVSNSTASAPYVVKLVIATNSIFNSTAEDQPAYFVIGPNGLESAGRISVPVHRLIELVIVNYDDGNASLLQSNGGAVAGTKGGTVFIASNDNINASQGISGIDVVGGQNVSSVPADELAHTFTVPTLNLNVPVPLSTTVVAYFTIDQAGTYLWFCETACGDAAMSTTGWMQGSLVAS
jgi:hypothetical protein